MAEELERYFSEIRKRYDSDENSRGLILRGLERLSPGIDFDFEKAKQIREDLNLKKSDLADHLTYQADTKFARRGGVDFRSMSTLISAVESGKISLKHPPRAETMARKYLLWLKEQGYNPHNL